MTGRHEFPLLFGLLWPAQGHTPNVANWEAIDRVAAQHRLRPLLHKRCPDAPEPFASQWREAHHRAAMRALRQRAELSRIAGWFGEAGIESVALKGAGIVWRGWTDPAIRPMRDLDLLVPVDQALQAHALLRAEGFTGPEATSLADGKHLAGLTAPASGVHVELHTRLIEAFSPAWALRDEAFRAAALDGVEREGEIARTCDSDTLLHVIIHAVLDHQFNNGPVLLCDIDLLVRHGTIDWQRFWKLAATTASLRACQLALSLAEAVVPQLTIEWHGHAPMLPRETLHAAAAMMLVDMDRRSELGAAGQIARLGRGERLARLTKLMTRARSSDPHSPQSRAGGLGAMVASYAGVLFKSDDRQHIRRSLGVARWLKSGN